MIQEQVDLLKADVQDQLGKLDEVKAQLEGKLVALDNLASEAKAEYDRGFNDGLAQAGQLGGSDKIYSDAEMNQQIADDQAKLDAAVASKQAELDLVKLDLEVAKQAQADAEAKLAADEAKIAQAKSDLA